MVLVKMLMEIDPLPIRGSMVMMMVTISPSQRDVSPAEQLRRSPRLVQPRFRLETEALRPESFLMIFPGRKTPYTRRWASGGFQVAHEAGGAPRGVRHALRSCWAPSRPLTSIFCYMVCFDLEKTRRKLSG